MEESVLMSLELQKMDKFVQTIIVVQQSRDLVLIEFILSALIASLTVYIVKVLKVMPT